MTEFKIALAGSSFEVKCKFDSTKDYCADYLYDGNVRYAVVIDESDIKYERERDELRSNDEYLETIALYRKICERIIEEDVILFHSSAIELDGKAYVFSGPSGTGKSTHASLWRSFFKNKDIHMINDDKPLIRIDETIYVYGTPWMGKAALGENRKAPIQGICFLKQGKENKIHRLSKNDAFQKMYVQTYRSNDKENLLKTMRLVNSIVERIPVWELECTISCDAVKTAYESMSGVKI